MAPAEADEQQDPAAGADAVIHLGWATVSPAARPRDSAPAGPAPSPRLPPLCRVEHRTGEGTALLALARCLPHRSELVPYASRLRLEGRASGELALVDEATGATVARLRLDRPPRRRPGGGT